MRAPVVIAVISERQAGHKIPEWEQILSAGAVCQNLLVAASLAGFAAQWLTEWYTYDAHIQSLFNIGEHEDIAGFVYLGSAEKRPDERARPDKHTRINAGSSRVNCNTLRNRQLSTQGKKDGRCRYY